MFSKRLILRVSACRTLSYERFSTTTFHRRQTPYDRTTFYKKYRFGFSQQEPNTPEKFKRYDDEFARYSDFDHQLEMLKSKGYRRPYTPYVPPVDLEERFARVCSKVLPGKSLEALEMSNVDLESDLHLKARLMNEMSKAMGGHMVPNSMNHLMKTLDRLFHFYSVPVDQNTSYERLEAASKRGELPPNLHVLLDPIRFDAEKAREEGATQTVALVTAFPKSTTILSKPESRKRYKQQKPQGNPFKTVPPRNADGKTLK